MNVENLNTQPDPAAIDPAVAAGQTEMLSEDDQLSALYDEIGSDEPARGEDGKFKATGDDAGADGSSREGEEPGGEGETDGSSTLTAAGAPLPANWNGMDEDWAKIPPDMQQRIAAREQELHVRMSEQGRQISQYKPIFDVVEQNSDLLAGKKTPDGREVTPAFAVAYLLNAQRRIVENPVAALIEMADAGGVREHLLAALSGRAPIPQTVQQSQPAITPADIAKIVQDTIAEDAKVRSADEEVSRLSKGKPLFADIAEEDMVTSIHKARRKLGDAASKEAVFDLAYDMAVNADPDLRAKAAALAKKAAGTDPKKVESAKRANGVNVTSTSSGKARDLTEDEVLSQAYDAAKSKD